MTQKYQKNNMSPHILSAWVNSVYQPTRHSSIFLCARHKALYGGVSLVSRRSGCPACVVVCATVTIVSSVLTVHGSNLFGFLPCAHVLKVIPAMH